MDIVETTQDKSAVSGEAVGDSFADNIIKRYEPFQKNKFIFPDLNYWNICKPLKTMIKECGITKDISFHSSRHSFATLALSKGMPIESVSKILGHTNIVTTQRYAKVTTEKIDKDLTTLKHFNEEEKNQYLLPKNKLQLLVIDEIKKSKLVLPNHFSYLSCNFISEPLRC